MECEWCGEEGHKPAELVLGCCGATEMRCNGPGEQAVADEAVCAACDAAHDERVREAIRQDRLWDDRRLGCL